MRSSLRQEAGAGTRCREEGRGKGEREGSAGEDRPRQAGTAPRVGVCPLWICLPWFLPATVVTEMLLLVTECFGTPYILPHRILPLNGAGMWRQGQDIPSRH